MTPRQAEVVQLVAEGQTARRIGVLLGLSTRTVEGHLHQARQRIGVSTVAELVAWAVAIGIVSPCQVPSSPNSADEMGRCHHLEVREEIGSETI